VRNLSREEILSPQESANSPDQKKPAATKRTYRSARLHFPSQSNSTRAIKRPLARHVDSPAGAGKIGNHPPNSYVDLPFHESPRHLESFRAAGASHAGTRARSLVLNRSARLDSAPFSAPPGGRATSRQATTKAWQHPCRSLTSFRMRQIEMLREACFGFNGETS